jgi:hypothetical protein
MNNMTSRTPLILILSATLLLAAIGAYLFWPKDTVSVQEPAGTAAEEATKAAAAAGMELAFLIAQYLADEREAQLAALAVGGRLDATEGAEAVASAAAAAEGAPLAAAAAATATGPRLGYK